MCLKVDHDATEKYRSEYPESRICYKVLAASCGEFYTPHQHVKVDVPGILQSNRISVTFPSPYKSDEDRLPNDDQYAYSGFDRVGKGIYVYLSREDANFQARLMARIGVIFEARCYTSELIAVGSAMGSKAAVFREIHIGTNTEEIKQAPIQSYILRQIFSDIYWLVYAETAMIAKIRLARHLNTKAQYLFLSRETHELPHWCKDNILP